MKVLKGLMVLLTTTMLTVLMSGIAVWAGGAASPAQDNPRSTLIERFKQTSRTDHKAAYEAAKEFLQKYPNDPSEDAQFIRRWLAAYEKVELGGAGTSKDPVSPATSAELSKNASLPETVDWLNTQMQANLYTSKFTYKDGNRDVEMISRFSRRLKISGDVLIIEKWESVDGKAFRPDDKGEIPLAKLDSVHLDINKFDEPLVSLNATGNWIEFFDWHGTNNRWEASERPPDRRGYYGIAFNDKSVALRVLDGFYHLLYAYAHPDNPTEPGLAATITWLRKVIDAENFSYDSHSNSGTVQFVLSQRVLDFKDCTLEYEATEYIAPYSHRTTTSTTKVDLRRPHFLGTRTLVERESHNQYSYLSLRETKTTKTRSSPGRQKEIEYADQPYFAPILIRDAKLADRVNQAVLHAARLCRQSQSSDPF